MLTHTTARGQHIAVLLLLALSLASAAAAQQSADPFIQPAPRALTVTAGFGNAMGWFGAQGEHYVRAERLGLFAGVGYLPAVDTGDPSGLTFAAGVRAYTKGQKHRAFLEASISQIAVETAPCYGDCLRAYGPGAQLGYQFVGSGGFSILASAGVGYAPTIPDGRSKVGTLLGLGFGYTWRR